MRGCVQRRNCYPYLLLLQAAVLAACLDLFQRGSYAWPPCFRVWDLSDVIWVGPDGLFGG